jgi:hypothetical protein
VSETAPRGTKFFDLVLAWEVSSLRLPKMHHIFEALTALGVKLKPPADATVIERVVSHHGITLPKEAWALYELANGSDGEFGEWSWHYWSIDSEDVTLAGYLKRPREFVVSPDARKIDPSKYVRFFDCLIDLPLYAYCADNDSPHFGEVIGCTTDNGTFDAFVSAKTISGFLEKLIATRGDETMVIDEG